MSVVHATNVQKAAAVSIRRLFACWLSGGIQAACLIVAGLLKIHELGRNPSFRLPFLDSATEILGIAELEILVGLWFLLGFWPASAKRAIILSYSCLAVVNLVHLIGGGETCGCAGVFQINTIYVLIFDATALAGLPFSRVRESTHNRLGFVLLCFLLLFTQAWVANLAWSGRFVSDLIPEQHDYDSFRLCASYLLAHAGVAEHLQSVPQVSTPRDVAFWHERVRAVVGQQGYRLIELNADEVCGYLEGNEFSQTNPLVVLNRAGYASLYAGTHQDITGKLLYCFSTGGEAIPHDLSFLKRMGISKGLRLDPPDSSPPLSLGSTRLIISKAAYNFGVVQPNADLLLDIQLSNTGGHSALLDYPPKTSCGCLTHGMLKPQEVAPNESFTIKVSLKSTQRTVGSQWVKFRAKNLQDDTTLDFVVRLFAFQIGILKAIPDRIDFGAHYS